MLPFITYLTEALRLPETAALFELFSAILSFMSLDTLLRGLLGLFL